MIPFATKTQFRIAQRKIYEDLPVLGTLQYVGGSIVDLVYHLSPDNFFKHASTPYAEWVLRPRNWVALRFSPDRYSGGGKIHVSIDARINETPDEKDLVFKTGRYPSWSRFTVTSVSQLEAALRTLAGVCQARCKGA